MGYDGAGGAETVLLASQDEHGDYSLRKGNQDAEEQRAALVLVVLRGLRLKKE